MTDRPIIFSGPMVRALLDGRKTQTRRIIKVNGMLPDFCGGRGDIDDPACWGWEDHNHGDWVTLEKEPGQRMGWRDWRGAYRTGDRLWVRETCATWEGALVDVVHRADLSEKEWFDLLHDARNGAPWKRRPSIHMPRWASRLTLTVKDVRVQRLQETSAEDCAREGVRASNQRLLSDGYIMAQRAAFRTFWNSLHGPDAWDANPWVFALSFDVHRCNIDKVEE